MLYGVGEEGEEGRPGTVYIWSPGLAGRGFDAYLREVREKPGEDPQGYICGVLQAVGALTHCVKALHTAGLLHLDIKPDNFMIPCDSNRKDNTRAISLFDTNTLYDVSAGGAPRTAGTPGFRAPELRVGNASPCSDIYSIGAVLFYALVITDEIPDGRYQDKYYPDIGRLLENSVLMQEAAKTGGEEMPQLLGCLEGILKMCLAAESWKRYEGCSPLLEALQRAEGIASGLGSGRREAADESGDGAEIVMQKLLYDHPLYSAIDPSSGKISVLVLGSEDDTRKFIDAALQAGQMKGYALSVTVLSDAPEEARNTYLGPRPDLTRFVRVEGVPDHMPGEQTYEAYARLRFRRVADPDSGTESTVFFGQDDAQNEKLAGYIVAERLEEQDRFYDYTFISLGDSALNRSVAERLVQKLEDWTDKDPQCPICFVSEGSAMPPVGRAGNICPVVIPERIDPETIGEELEQMAFKVHTVWDGSLNRDIEDLLEQFRRDKSDYKSSLANAISIKYKLYSLGIILKDDVRGPVPEGAQVVSDMAEAAAVFYRDIVRKKQDEAISARFDAVVALEHRRWVLQQIADGYHAPPLDENGEQELSQCLRLGRAKAGKTHACLVFSREGCPLQGEAYTANNRAKWNDPEIDPELDELDQMSIRLHQLNRAEAERRKENNPLHSEDIQAIKRHILTADESVRTAFERFLFALKNILDGSESYSRQYGYYEGLFKDTLKVLHEDIQAEILRLVARVRELFIPMVEGNKYEDYKLNDEKLVSQIPYILAFHLFPRVAMAFEDGRDRRWDNEATFPDVAAATVLNPREITYLYCFDQSADLKKFLDKVSAVMNYLEKRKIHTRIHFAVACLRNEPAARRVKKGLEALRESSGASAQLGDCTVFDCFDTQEAAERLFDALRDRGAELYDMSTSMFHFAADDWDFIGRVKQGGMPCFEFDWRTKQFRRHDGCDYVQYLQSGSFIRVSDMFALMNAEDTRFHLPEFMNDFKKLWAVYTGKYAAGRDVGFENGVRNWNRLCMALGEYERGCGALAAFPLGGPPEDTKDMSFLLPAYATWDVSDLVTEMGRCGLVDRWKASNFTTYDFRLELVGNRAWEDKFRNVFKAGRRFDLVELTKDPFHKTVTLSYNDLNVVDACLDPAGGGTYGEYSYMVLEALQEKQFIQDLTIDRDRQPATVSFSYTSPKIKKLLTTAGEILEIYTYYQVLDTGYFDDVQTSFEFRWSEENVKNELDLVLTKGFRSMIVECKAVQKLDMDYYLKLDSISGHFGIGTVKVLVGNTYLHSRDDINAVNEMERTRGNQLGIITIHEQNAIENIGSKLVEIMEKR